MKKYRDEKAPPWIHAGAFLCLEILDALCQVKGRRTGSS